jgi:transcriptional regulator with XRE-family HTH domain
MKTQRGPKKGSKFQGTHRYPFGSCLASERLKKGLTQAELATRMNTTVRVISHFEREVKNPPAETVKKLAAALNIPISKLLTTESHINESQIDRGLSKRFELAQKLPATARNDIKRYIDNVIKAYSLE